MPLRNAVDFCKSTAFLFCPLRFGVGGKWLTNAAAAAIMNPNGNDGQEYFPEQAQRGRGWWKRLRRRERRSSLSRGAERSRLCRILRVKEQAVLAAECVPKGTNMGGTAEPGSVP